MTFLSSIESWEVRARFGDGDDGDDGGGGSGGVDDRVHSYWWLW